MVFHKFKRRRIFKRRNGRRGFRRFHRGSLRRRVARVAKGVKNLRRLIEYKYYDTATGTTAIGNTTATNAAILLVDPAAGTGVTQRVGRNITVHRISIRGTFSYAEVGTATDALPMRFRVALVMDRRVTTPGTAPVIDTIWDDAAGGGNAWVDSYRNLQNYSHYKILWDKVFWINPFDVTVLLDPTRPARAMLRKNFKMKIPCEFDASANPVRNSMWLIFVGDRSSTTNSFYPIIQGLYTRAVYSDS